MDAVRCPECGDVRWSFFGFSPRSLPLACQLCGTQMVAERRRPKGMRRAVANVERRHEVFADPLPPVVPPAA